MALSLDEKRDCMRYNPFDGGKGDDGVERILFDRIVTARKPGDCAICFTKIEPGESTRRQVAIVDGDIGMWRICEACCAACASSWTDAGAAIEKRTRMGIAKAKAKACWRYSRGVAVSPGVKALNRLAKWRMILTGWQLGTRERGDPTSDAVRDHREATLLLRAELNALTATLIAKGVITAEEFDRNCAVEAEHLMRALEKRFPGATAGDDGMHLDTVLVQPLDVEVPAIHDLWDPALAPDGRDPREDRAPAGIGDAPGRDPQGLPDPGRCPQGLGPEAAGQARPHDGDLRHAELAGRGKAPELSPDTLRDLSIDALWRAITGTMQNDPRAAIAAAYGAIAHLRPLLGPSETVHGPATRCGRSHLADNL